MYAEERMRTILTCPDLFKTNKIKVVRQNCENAKAFNEGNPYVLNTILLLNMMRRLDAP